MEEVIDPTVKARIEHLVEGWTKKAFQHMGSEDFKKLKTDREYKDNVVGSLLADDSISNEINAQCFYVSEYIEMTSFVKEKFWNFVEKEIAKRKK